MSDADTAVGALSGGTDEQVGSYRWLVREDRWHWSDELYRIHGFAPGEVRPTTELLWRHKHPDDVDEARASIKSAVATGAPFSCYHRVVDARCKVRSVVVVGEGWRGPSGDVEGLRGYFVDLTEARRRDTRLEVAEAVDGVRRHAADIEQVKGALMLAHGVDKDTAFAILRRCSQDTNVKVD
jgi:hypothetical protein